MLPRCGARYVDAEGEVHACELEAGHQSLSGNKHKDTGIDHSKRVMWTDAGAARVQKEREERSKS